MASAARTIAVGDASVCIAGGVESMTRAPWVLPKSERPYPAGDATLASTTLGWRLVNPEMPDVWTVSLGEATEGLGEKYAVTREAADAFAARSQQLAARAWEAGVHDRTVVQVPGATLARDEGIRDGVTPETLAGLKPVVPGDRDRHGRQRVPTLRRRRRSPARRRGRPALSSTPSRWPGSPPPGWTRSTRSCSGSDPCRRSGGR